jgi:hypothetical protein
MGSAGVSSHEEVSSHSAARMNSQSVELNSYAGGVNSYSEQFTLREGKFRASSGRKLVTVRRESELPFRGSSHSGGVNYQSVRVNYS